MILSGDFGAGMNGQSLGTRIVLVLSIMMGSILIEKMQKAEWNSPGWNDLSTVQLIGKKAFLRPTGSWSSFHPVKPITGNNS